MARHCCDKIARQVDFSCASHDDPSDCPDALIIYVPKFDEYGIRLHDGGTSYMLIQFCPWCGARLPASRRCEWFDRLEALGIENPAESEIPAEFTTDAWYRDA